MAERQAQARTPIFTAFNSDNTEQPANTFTVQNPYIRADIFKHYPRSNLWRLSQLSYN